MVLDPFRRGFFIEELIGYAAWHDFRLFLIRFIIFGLLGYNVEVIFTSLDGFARHLLAYGWPADLGGAMQAKTGILAFFIYCWAVIPYTFLPKKLRKIFPGDGFGLWIRGLCYAFIFLVIEFVTGLLAFFISGYMPWNYSHIPLNVMGIITFAFLPFWLIAGIIGEWLNDRLLQIDDIFLDLEAYKKTKK